MRVAREQLYQLTGVHIHTHTENLYLAWLTWRREKKHNTEEQQLKNSIHFRIAILQSFVSVSLASHCRMNRYGNIIPTQKNNDSKNGSSSSSFCFPMFMYTNTFIPHMDIINFRIREKIRWSELAPLRASKTTKNQNETKQMHIIRVQMCSHIRNEMRYNTGECYKD